MEDPIPATAELDEKNALALAIVLVVDQQPFAVLNHASGTTGWELALVTTPSSNESATTASKLVGVLDLLTLDSLYDDALRRNNQNLELLAFFLVELSLVEYGMLKFPHQLSAAGAYTAQCATYGFKQWSKTCEWHTNYSEDQLLSPKKARGEMLIQYF